MEPPSPRMRVDGTRPALESRCCLRRQGQQACAEVGAEKEELYMMKSARQIRQQVVGAFVTRCQAKC